MKTLNGIDHIYVFAFIFCACLGVWCFWHADFLVTSMSTMLTAIGVAAVPKGKQTSETS